MEIILLLIISFFGIGIFSNNSSKKNYTPHNRNTGSKPQKNWTFDFETLGEKDSSWNALREKIFKRDNYKCVQCGFPKNLTVDHITPRHAGGTDELHNLRTLCMLCHEEVHNRKIFGKDEVFSNKQKVYNPSSKVQAINRAINSDSFISIKYSDEKGRITYRDIRPIKIFEEHGVLYVRSYCRLRNDERTFRISRITIN